MTREEIIKEVLKERERQDLRWGTVPERTVSGLSEYECLAILTEEVGECARALNEREDFQRKGEELIQVMAYAMLWLEVMERRSSQDCPWCEIPTRVCTLHDQPAGGVENHHPGPRRTGD